MEADDIPSFDGIRSEVMGFTTDQGAERGVRDEYVRIMDLLCSLEASSIVLPRETSTILSRFICYEFGR